LVSVVHRINAAFGLSPKFVPYQWSATDVLDKNSMDMPKFNDDISLMFYHNAQQHQCVLVFKTTTKESITGGTACYIGNVTNTKYMPKGTVRAYTIASGYSAALTKNSTNIVIAFSCHSGTIPANTTIDMQLEWTYI
jgi:hypothetical protein